MAEYQGFYAYEIVKDKPSLIKDKVVYKQLDGNAITIGDVVKYKKFEFLKVKLNEKDLYLILNKGFAYKENMRSVSYWKELQKEYSEKNQYILATSKLISEKFENIETATGFSKYLPVMWLPVNMPGRLNDEVVFTFKVKGTTEIDVDIPFKDIAKYEADFVTATQYDSERETYEQEIEAAERVQAQRDAAIDNSSVFEATILLTREAKRKLNEKAIEYDFDSKLKFSVYSSRLISDGIGDKKTQNRVYKGFVLQKTIELPENAVSFTYPADKEYMDRRGNLGEVERMKTAELNDLAFTKH